MYWQRHWGNKLLSRVWSLERAWVQTDKLPWTSVWTSRDISAEDWEVLKDKLGNLYLPFLCKKFSVGGFYSPFHLDRQWSLIMWEDIGASDLELWLSWGFSHLFTAKMGWYPCVRVNPSLIRNKNNKLSEDPFPICINCEEKNQQLPAPFPQPMSRD